MITMTAALSVSFFKYYCYHFFRAGSPSGWVLGHGALGSSMARGAAGSLLSWVSAELLAGDSAMQFFFFHFF